MKLRNAINPGYVTGPRIDAAGKSIATTGGHADPTNGFNARPSHLLGPPRPTEGVVNSPEDARQAVRQRYKDGVDLIKITATGGVTSTGHGTQMDDEVLALMKKHGTWHVPTITAGKFVAEKARVPGYFPEVVRPKAERLGPQIQQTFGKAYCADMVGSAGS